MTRLEIRGRRPSLYGGKPGKEIRSDVINTHNKRAFQHPYLNASNLLHIPGSTSATINAFFIQFRKLKHNYDTRQKK